MRLLTLAPSAVISLLIANASVADPPDALVGDWISPDGYAKQSIERQFDGSWYSTRMWFRMSGDWKLVGTGSIYKKPRVTHWTMVSRPPDMDGIELFESKLRSNGDKRFQLENTAIKSDGTVILTEEDWHFVDEDNYTYIIYKIDYGKRTPWMEGSWVRLAGEE